MRIEAASVADSRTPLIGPIFLVRISSPRWNSMFVPKDQDTLLADNYVAAECGSINHPPGPDNAEDFGDPTPP